MVTDLPDASYYKQDKTVVIPSNRSYFKGNNLDFSIKTPGFTIFNTYTWADTATDGISGDITIVGATGGITTSVANKTVQAFYCK